MDRIVPEVLRLARERRRVTQRTMAEALGTRQSSVAELESLTGPPVSEQWISRYATALDTTVAIMLAEYDEHAAEALPRGARNGDPPAEPFAAPGPGREEQLRRLWARCEGNAAQIARVVGVSPQRIRQVAASIGLAR